MKLFIPALMLLVATSCGHVEPESHKSTDTTPEGTVPEDLVPEQWKPGIEDTFKHPKAVKDSLDK